MGKDCKICRVCDPLYDQILELYRTPMSGSEIREALGLGISTKSVNNWLTRHIPDEERAQHRKEVYTRLSRQTKGMKLPQDHDRTGRLLCGNCREWTPDEGGRINTHRFGRCAKHDIAMTRCGYCVDEVAG